MRVTPEKAMKIIGATAVLHNIAIDRDTPIPDTPYMDEAREDEEPLLIPFDPNLRRVGVSENASYRAHLIDTYFAHR